MKKIYSFLFALIALMVGVNAQAQTYSLATAIVSPEPGSKVETLNVINVDARAIPALGDPANGGFASTWGSHPWLTDDKGNTYNVSISDQYDGRFQFRIEPSAITADGTYTLTIPAGDNAMKPYNSLYQAYKIEEISWTWTIGEEKQDPEPEPSTGWNFDESTFTPAQGQVDELKQIKIDYKNLGFVNGLDGKGYYGQKEWLSDGTTTYTVNVADDYDNNIYSITLGTAITTPGTYTLTIPAGELYPYGGVTDNTNAEMTYTWTIKGQDAPEGDNTFYVESIKATSADGIIITFSEDVKQVKHNLFGTSEEEKCLMYTDFSVTATPMNVGKPTVKGNVVTCPKTYGSNLVSGNSITITLQPQNFIGVSDNTLGGETVWTVTVDEGQKIGAIKVTQYAPTDGNRKVGTLNNISAEFDPRITAVADETLIVLKNENGHVLPFSSVGLDSENPNGAININVDENAMGEEGTTYSLHILPGAIVCGGSTNDEEIVFGKWYMNITPITLTLTPGANSVIEELATVVVADAAGGELTLAGDVADITISGIMEYQVNTYATCTSAVKNADGSYTLSFDKVLKPGFEAEVADIEVSQASKKDVKINIPAGTFKVGSHQNLQTQAIYTIQENVVLGEITWTFNPAADTTVETLGVASVSEDENGSKTTYSINFKITEENNNLYVRIPDASEIKIYDASGKAVKSFGQYDVLGGTNNEFELDLSTSPLTAVGPAAKTGEFTLIIPADAVFYYTDANYNSEPTHPAEDIEVSWTLAPSTAINAISGEATGKVVYTITGVKVKNAQKGILIQNGKKTINK